MLPFLTRAIELVPEVKAHLSDKALEVLGMKYDPNQPRIPAGSDRGGEWTDEESNKPIDITETPEFKAWFGNSKAVDENGKPLILYHGTNADFDIFEEGLGKLEKNRGIFFTDNKEAADAFAVNNKIKEVYLNIRNPLIIEGKGEHWLNIEFEGKKIDTDMLANLARERGYDGVILRNVADPYPILQTEYIVLKPEQIKSVDNIGTFDPDDPNIYKSIETYDRQLWSYALDLYRTGDGGVFLDKFIAAIANQLTRAWNEGAREVGVDPKEMTDDDRAELKAIIDGEYDQIIKLAEAIMESRSGTLDEFRQKFRSRIDLWVNRYTDVIGRARVYFGGKTRLKWTLGKTEEHCETCATLNGIVAFASEWELAGIKPQSPPNSMLACSGWNCDCSLDVTDRRRSPNALDTLMNIATARNL
jgi:hypothetical protein